MADAADVDVRRKAMRPRPHVVMSTTRGFGDALRSPQPPLTLGNLSRSEQLVTGLVALLPATASSLGHVAHNLGLALPGAAGGRPAPPHPKGK